MDSTSDSTPRQVELGTLLCHLFIPPIPDFSKSHATIYVGRDRETQGGTQADVQRSSSPLWLPFLATTTTKGWPNFEYNRQARWSRQWSPKPLGCRRTTGIAQVAEPMLEAQTSVSVPYLSSVLECIYPCKAQQAGHSVHHLLMVDIAKKIATMPTQYHRVCSQ